MKHPHYDKIVKWASDPERFKVEVSDSLRGGWIEVEYPSWVPDATYRVTERHPEPWHINGKEFPEPLKEEPEEGQSIYKPDPSDPQNPLHRVWGGTSYYDERCLKNRILHDNREAAVAHAYAMLNAQPIEKKEQAGQKGQEKQPRPPEAGDIGWVSDYIGRIIKKRCEQETTRTIIAIDPSDSSPYETESSFWEYFLRESDGILFGPDLKPVKGNQWRDEQ